MTYFISFRFSNLYLGSFPSASLTALAISYLPTIQLVRFLSLLLVSQGFVKIILVAHIGIVFAEKLDDLINDLCISPPGNKAELKLN